MVATLLASASCGPDDGPEPEASLPYRIEIESVVSLGSPGDSILLDWSADLAANESAIAVGGLPVRGALALHDLQGRQVRAVAPYGGGPSEFRRPRPAVGPGDSLWIFDAGNQRVSVLEPNGRAVARAGHGDTGQCRLRVHRRLARQAPTAVIRETP